MAGKWEFPGGKVSAGESLDACIRREIREELGLSIGQARHVDTVEQADHVPPIRLHFLECCVDPAAQPVCHEGQQAAWFSPAELATLDLLPADRTFVSRLAAAASGPASPG